MENNTNNNLLEKILKLLNESTNITADSNGWISFETKDEINHFAINDLSDEEMEFIKKILK